MDIYSHAFHRQLIYLNHMKGLKEAPRDFLNERKELLQFYLSNAPTPTHIEQLSVSYFSFTGVEIPQADENEHDIHTNVLVNSYKEQLARLLKTMLPHETIRINQNSISIRINPERLERANNILRAFQEDAYWNDYFTKKYPSLANGLNNYSSQKTRIERITSNNASFIQKVSTSQNEFIHFKFFDMIHGTFVTSFERVQLSGSNRESYARSRFSYLDLEGDNLTRFRNRYAESPFIVDNIRSVLSYFSSIFLLDGIYDFMKMDMENHFKELHETMLTERQEAFQRLEKWYDLTHVDHDNKTFMPLFADNHLSSFPEKQDLFLYSSDSSHEWKAVLIHPLPENPMLDGHAAPVVGSFTKTVDNSGRMTVNDYFDVQMDLQASREIWLQHSSMETDLLLDGYTAISHEEFEVRSVDMPVPSEPEETISFDDIPTTDMKTVTIEELFRQHGVTMPQQEEVVVPEYEEPDAQDAERPRNYRVTRCGDNTFSLFFLLNGQDVLISNLSHDALKRELTRNRLIENLPAVIRFDDDESRANTLDRPFRNPSNYLVY